jgi:RimJ/RimL family protein N-acetyltransferase
VRASELVMKSDIIIKDYSPSDYQDIVYAGYPFNLADLKSWHGWKGWVLRIIYFFARLDRKVFVAYSTDDRKTVGIVTLTKINDRIWGLWNIFVSPSHRRQGISTQLYQKCFQYLRNKKVKKAVGSVEIDNIGSIKGLEKTWDRFLSQKFYYYSGTAASVPCAKTDGIIIRNFHPRDREILFQIFNRCTSQDWKTSLEITKENFLDRFIGKTYGKGLSKLLTEKRIFIAEENGKIVGYTIVARRCFVQKSSNAATLFLFFDPQLSYEVTLSSISKIVSTLIVKGTKTLSVYSLAHDENTVEQVLTNLNMTPKTLMVPIIEFDYIPKVGDVRSKC